MERLNQSLILSKPHFLPQISSLSGSEFSTSPLPQAAGVCVAGGATQLPSLPPSCWAAGAGTLHSWSSYLARPEALYSPSCLRFMAFSLVASLYLSLASCLSEVPSWETELILTQTNFVCTGKSGGQGCRIASFPQRRICSELRIRKRRLFPCRGALCVSLFYSSQPWWVLPSLRASLSAVLLLCESPALGSLLNVLLEILPSPSPACSTRELAQVRGLRRSPFLSILSSPHTCHCPLRCCRIVSHFATLSFYPISQNKNRYGMKSLIYWCCLVGVQM